MITSFIQYLLMGHSYIAVLNVYAVRDFYKQHMTTYPHPPFASSRTSMLSLGVLKVITKSVQIRGWLPPARTRTKWKLQFLLLKMISTLHEDAIHVLTTTRSNRKQILLHSRRIIVGVSGQTCCFLGRCLMYVASDEMTRD